jgi:hypothetical protein
MRMPRRTRVCRGHLQAGIFFAVSLGRAAGLKAAATTPNAIWFLAAVALPSLNPRKRGEDGSGNQLLPARLLVAYADRSSIAVCGLMLSSWTRSGPGLSVALRVSVALCVTITLGIPVALCIAIALRILTGIRPRRALRPGLSLRSRRAPDSQQHQKKRTHKQRSLHFDSPL